MGTRSTMLFIDQDSIVQIYRHWDGYPSSILPDLDKARKLAWGFPRFEADEFAAAVVATMKVGEGNVRIQNPPSREDLFENVNWDVEWVYVIEKKYREDWTPEQALLEPTMRIYDWNLNDPRFKEPAMSERPFSEAVKWDDEDYLRLKYPEDYLEDETDAP
jgi:hypothetical protein